MSLKETRTQDTPIRSQLRNSETTKGCELWVSCLTKRKTSEGFQKKKKCKNKGYVEFLDLLWPLLHDTLISYTVTIKKDNALTHWNVVVSKTVLEAVQ